jgi:hypothetical protein
MYYVLDRFWASHPARWIEKFPSMSNVDWDLGQRHKQSIPTPLRFELEPFDPDDADQSSDMPELFKGHVPLFRDDLIAGLLAAGVDNLETYDAEILDPDSGTVHRNYKAVNVIGAASVVDMERSSATVHPGGPVLDVELEGFAVDETRAGGRLLFRLAENTSAIMIHESVADHLDSLGFTSLEYLDSGEVSL